MELSTVLGSICFQHKRVRKVPNGAAFGETGGKDDPAAGPRTVSFKPDLDLSSTKVLRTLFGFARPFDRANSCLVLCCARALNYCFGLSDGPLPPLGASSPVSIPPRSSCSLSRHNRPNRPMLFTTR
jgi:hypothetical protein